MIPKINLKSIIIKYVLSEMPKMLNKWLLLTYQWISFPLLVPVHRNLFLLSQLSQYMTGNIRPASLWQRFEAKSVYRERIVVYYYTGGWLFSTADSGNVSSTDFGGFS